MFENSSPKGGKCKCDFTVKSVYENTVKYFYDHVKLFDLSNFVPRESRIFPPYRSERGQKEEEPGGEVVIYHPELSGIENYNIKF